MRAQFIASEIAIGLRRNLTMTIAVILTTAVSLTTVGSALLLRKQVGVMKDNWYDKIEVTIYLCDHISPSPNCHGKDVSQDQVTQIGNELAANKAVQKTYFETKAQAFENFKSIFKDSPDIIRNTDPNALPESWRVKLKNPNDFAVIATAFQDEPGVDSITDIRKTLEPIFDMLRGAGDAALIFAGISLIASALLVFNTIRVAAFSRRRETGIMRLVGASNLYIRLPFLLEGAIAGFVGAGLASLALVFAKIGVVDGVFRPHVKFTPFIGWGEVYSTIPVLIVIGVGMATLSSFVAIQRHLRV